MLEKSVALGEKLHARFKTWQQQFDIIGEIRGLGAMLGIELVKGPTVYLPRKRPRPCRADCFENGLSILVCGSYGNIIRVLAPFVITDEQLNKGLDIMEAGIRKISS